MRTFDVGGGTGGGPTGAMSAGLGGSSGSATRTFDLAPGVSAPGFVMTFARNEEIFGEGETADFVYRVQAGAVRTLRILADGRRQIAAFHLPGDLFGLEVGETHGLTAEALGECRIVLVRRAAVDRAAASDCGVARALWGVATGDLARVQSHMLLLCRKSAVERIAAFLLEMSSRTADPNGVELPMSRTDIGDYLGLTIETVSRSLTQLERDGVVALPSIRRIHFLNRGALEACAA